MGRQDAWEEMEAKATGITNEKFRKQKKIDEKIEAIKKYNREHPIKTTTVTVYISDSDQTDFMKIAIESARWTGAHYAKKFKGFFAKK